MSNQFQPPFPSGFSQPLPVQSQPQFAPPVQQFAPVQSPQPPVHANVMEPQQPFGIPVNMAANLQGGAASIEAERANTEVKSRIFLAREFPRKLDEVYQKVLEACKRPSLAERGVFDFPRGGQSVSGPSIRLAEELARSWGNLDLGYRELSRIDGASEMEAYCWDIETNVTRRHVFTVEHKRDKKGQTEKLKDLRDIYENNANQAARRLRTVILSVLPPDLVEAAVAECRRTVASGIKNVAQEARNMVQAFGGLRVTQAQLEAYFGCNLVSLTAEQVVEGRGIYQAIASGAFPKESYFDDAMKQEALSLNSLVGGRK